MNLQHQNEPAIVITGRNIRRWREFREMNGENLAHAIGMDKSQVSKIENGRSPEVSVRTIEKIAKALDLTFEQLIFTNPQRLIAITQSFSITSINHPLQNSADTTSVDELRQQLKAKDDHIKLLQAQLPAK